MTRDEYDKVNILIHLAIAVGTLKALGGKSGAPEDFLYSFLEEFCPDA